MVHRESSFSANQATPAASKASPVTRGSVRRGSGFVQVWLGVTCENKKSGLMRVDLLRKIPAAVRFVSFEPLLEDLGELTLDGIHWAIVGGETGRSARILDIEWTRSIVEQCQMAGVAAWVKQLGRRPTIRGEAIILNDKGKRDLKGENVSIWPGGLGDLKVRQSPRADFSVADSSVLQD